MYLEMHSSWLSHLQTYEEFWVPVPGLCFPGNWMCPTLPLLLPPRELPRCQDPRWQGGKALRALCPSPKLHTQLPSLRGRLESTLRGEGKALPLLNTAARCAELEWQGMEQTARPLPGDNDTSSF